MATSYGQFCPLVKPMEVLDERWTMLIIRELTQGSRHSNDLRRGVPRLSPSLLSKRLAMLARTGVVARRNDGGRVTHELTEAGWELEPIVQALGAWGVRWVPQLAEADLDPQLLLWDVHRAVTTWLKLSPLAGVPRAPHIADQAIVARPRAHSPSDQAIVARPRALPSR